MDSLLMAVNLGDDSDTVGAIAGGLAALFYGYDGIPEDWLAVIKRREWIEEMCKMEMQYCLEYALDSGYIPVIAHVERYNNIYDEPVRDLSMLKELGCMVQINLYSIDQDWGSRNELANLFLKYQLVDFVGTDTHRLDYKSPEAEVGAAALREKYGDEYANMVLYRNAENLLM